MNRCLTTFLASLASAFAVTTNAAQFKFPNQTLTVPDGFAVELVAATNLLSRPISGSFDEQGRLYVTDSSGANEPPDQQLANPTHRIVRLEDTDGDGRFDKSAVFADKVMFPEGCLWHDGSLYVACPPSIWKLTDTNGDGVADVRVEWHQGKTLTGCANDLHGPYLGPDGWLYWCKGAFAEQSYEVNGQPFKSRAAHIFRARPDHSRFEPVLTGGMDNPVGLAFTATGERILCGTFLAPDEPGHRDGLIHAIYGGVYGKPHDVLDGHKRTGDLLPVMTHMGAAAPAAVRRYESDGFGDEYRDTLFCCQFNLHKISRHTPIPDGATFKTKDSDFLISDSTDFHPTDVIEDADGSLLVLDTGPWYKMCCPTSQLSKPDLFGAIYRVRRVGAKKIPDPRGLRLAWGKMLSRELVKRLNDERPAVRNRAIHELARQGERAIPSLAVVVQNFSFEERRNAVWALTRIDNPLARAAVRLAFADKDTRIQQAAIHSASVWRDVDSAGEISAMLNKIGSQVTNPPLHRVAAEALGRIGGTNAVRALLTAAAAPHDRVLEHSVIYALIECGSPNELLRPLVGLRSSWWGAYPEISRTMIDPTLGFFPAESHWIMTNGAAALLQCRVLVAIDQLDGSSLKPELMAPLLGSPNVSLRKTARWIAGHHPEWGGALAGFFRERLAAKNLNDDDRAELEKQLAQFAGDDAIQKLMADSLDAAATGPAMRRMLLTAMAEANLNHTPKSWPGTVSTALEAKDKELLRPAINTAGALGRIKTGPADFSEPLQRIAHDTTCPDDLRLDALAALPKGLKMIEPELLDFLLANLDPSKSVAMRGAAASVLVRANLSAEQLLRLTETLKTAGPLEVSRLLAAFEHTTDETVGLKLIAALKESKGLSGARPDALKVLAAKYPASVKQKADELLATMNVDAAKQKAHIDELLATLPKGEIRRGQAVFNSPKAACSSCHAIGYLGGHVGPDLTAIGPVRTERDLLEAIVYPSASFVRSYEPVIIRTKSGDDYSGVLKKDVPDEIVVATGPDTEVRVARADITDMRPGRVSVMPAGLDQMLTKQELADLVAFLKHTKWGAN